jgi:hypothetical protein
MSSTHPTGPRFEVASSEIADLVRLWRGQSWDLSSASAALARTGYGLPSEVQAQATRFTLAWAHEIEALARRALTLSDALASSAENFAVTDHILAGRVASSVRDVVDH